jgi:hypothetical protein
MPSRSPNSLWFAAATVPAEIPRSAVPILATLPCTVYCAITASVFHRLGDQASPERESPPTDPRSAERPGRRQPPCGGKGPVSTRGLFGEAIGRRNVRRHLPHGHCGGAPGKLVPQGVAGQHDRFKFRSSMSRARRTRSWRRFTTAACHLVPLLLQGMGLPRAR